MAWIVADDLTFGYGPDLLFQDLSFKLSDSFVALQGPSGSGKTTLLKLINRDISPLRGSVDYIGRSAILILQDDSLVPWLSGTENLRISRSFSPDRIFDERIFASMAHFVHRAAYQMSFGQRRYVEVVRALGSDSDVLLLDEPLNFLDAARREVLMQELSQQAKTRRVVMSTHYVEDFDGARIGRVQLQGVAPFRELVVHQGEAVA